VEIFDSVTVIGSGRAGLAISARLEERGLTLREHDGALLLVCVPDSAIADVARSIEPGPWVAHVSGATPLSALDPHVKRFGVHPLQTLVLWRGPEQLDGAWAAVTGETDEAQRRGAWLARTLGMEPFELADDDRALYHCAATFACPYLVTLHQIAASLFARIDAPPEALVPLMRRAIENNFELTGPIPRGDATTIEAHVRALHDRVPELEPLYAALAERTTT
jgi:predicted short-subunit dehydrogenase-like oxidoreductase (DUF2520 family)